jgi:hypothetical protein
MTALSTTAHVKGAVTSLMNGGQIQVLSMDATYSIWIGVHQRIAPASKMSTIKKLNEQWREKMSREFEYLYAARNKADKSLACLSKHSVVWYRNLGHLRQALTVASRDSWFNKDNYEIVKYKVEEEGTEPMSKKG